MYYEKQRENLLATNLIPAHFSSQDIPPQSNIVFFFFFYLFIYLVLNFKLYNNQKKNP